MRRKAKLDLISYALKAKRLKRSFNCQFDRVDNGVAADLNGQKINNLSSPMQNQGVAVEFFSNLQPEAPIKWWLMYTLTRPQFVKRKTSYVVEQQNWRLTKSRQCEMRNNKIKKPKGLRMQETFNEYWVTLQLSRFQQP